MRDGFSRGDCGARVALSPIRSTARPAMASRSRDRRRARQQQRPYDEIQMTQAKQFFELRQPPAARPGERCVHFSAQTDEWTTPQWIFDALHNEFAFTLDPCSDGTNAKCARFFTAQDNPLNRDWGTETVFVNPPYSECKAWMRKAYGAA